MEIIARKDWNLRRRVWIALDFALSSLAILLAYALQPGFDIGWTSSNPLQPGAFAAALIFPWLVLLASHVAGLHDPIGDRRPWLAILRISLAVLVALALFLLFLYVTALQQLGRSILSRAFIFSVAMLWGARLLLWTLARATPRRVGYYLEPERAARFRHFVDGHFFVAEFVAFAHDVVQRTAADVVDSFLRERVDEMVVSAGDISAFSRAVWLECLNRGLQVTEVAIFIEREYYMVPCDEIAIDWFLGIDLKWIHPFYHRVKRVVDFFAAGLAAVFTLPVMLLAALAIRLTSRGPILYSQMRAGFKGQPFRLWKLRTMKLDAETSGAQWAAKSDPRVTAIGRLLRRTRIDELPQLWNVILGEMSFIGPRPERPELVARIATEVELFPQRHWVKPGITGWAQINYPYGASINDAREKLSYDLYYIKNSSLLLDMQIALRTIGAVMKGSR
jgi:exopolysaccharide biosynthesis polyprenyl glycosylphosphotransferase